MRRLPRFMLPAAAMAAVLLAASLSGCAAVAQALTPGGLWAPLVSAAGTSPAAPVQPYSDGSTSERGNVPKAVGQKAGILSADGREHLLTFTVTRIVTDPHCLNAEAPAPSNGHYVEVDIQAITAADLGADGGGSTVTFAPENWFYYPPDGKGLIAGGIEAATTDDNCRVSVPALPESIGPSQTVSGSIVLDVAPGSVYLAYTPDNDCGCGTAWEWPVNIP